jgi:hypothetical protein
MSRSTGTPDAERRRLLKLAAFGIAAAPFASTLLGREARAADLPMVDDKDPTAQALGYHCVAGNNPAHKDAAAICATCMFYTAQNEKAGACVLFPGKAVCHGGWCTSYQKKVG